MKRQRRNWIHFCAELIIMILGKIVVSAEHEIGQNSDEKDKHEIGNRSSQNHAELK